MSRPILGDGMYVGRSQTLVFCLSEVKMEQNIADKGTLQQTCVSYPITRALKSIPVERDLPCNARGASRQTLMFARLL